MAESGWLQLDGRVVYIRPAVAADLPAIVALLRDDVLGAARETADLRPYRAAFEALAADPAHLLIVATHADAVLATLQLSFIPGLSRGATLRAQIEGVRVRADWRGVGLGGALFGWCIERARARGCGLVQLTTDKGRGEAHRFYGRLGFRPTHEGYKLILEPAGETTDQGR